MHRIFRGRSCAVLATTLALLALVLSHASEMTPVGVFRVNEGESVMKTLLVNPFPPKCPGGVLSYSVLDPHKNMASFPNPHDPIIRFTAPFLGASEGTMTVAVKLEIVCNGTTTVGSGLVVYFRVFPSPTTTPAPAPSFVCKSPNTVSVENNVRRLFKASEYVLNCVSPRLSITGITGPTPADPLFSVEQVDSASVVVFNADSVSVPAGEYVASILVSCGSSTCETSQRVVVSAPTTAPSVMECPGDFEYSLMLNKDGEIKEHPASLFARVAAVGIFCVSGQMSQALRQPAHGTVRADPNGFFYYTPQKPQVGDLVDSFGFELTCYSDGSKCTGTAVISVLNEDDDNIYHALDGDIVCRGTCDTAAWRTSPTALDLFDVNTSGVVVTPRKDGRPVNGMEFGFTLSGELFIHAYTTIGNLASRFVSFYPLSKTQSEGLLNSATFPDGSHVSFDPSCLDNQASTGKATDIWSWTNLSALEGHLNIQAGAYKAGDNYYQKFGGNHRQCDVYRKDPCQYAPFMTPTRNDDNNNVFNNATPSVQWKLYINGCDATWVGRASVASLRALRQPDGSPTFRPEGNGRYLVGTVYSQSLKPASWTSPSAGIVHSENAYGLRLKIHNIIIVEAVSRPVKGSDGTQLQMNADIQYSPGNRTSTLERIYRYSVLLYPYFAGNKTAANVTDLSLKVVSTTLVNSTWTSPSKMECPKCTGTKISCKGTGKGFETDCGGEALITFEPLVYNASDFEEIHDEKYSIGNSASTTVSPKNALRVTFAARANGAGSAELTGAYPVGSFTIAVALSSGQIFDVVVNQTDYISELNTRFLDTELCRPSAYWPVPDPLGSSVPVKPYSAEASAISNRTSTTEEKEGAKPAKYYGPPERLTIPSVCATPPNMESHSVAIENMTAIIEKKNKKVRVSMCAVQDERTFGTTDWIMFSFPRILEETKMINSEEIQSIIDDESLSNDSYTVAQLQYLTLSVSSSEVMASWLVGSPTNGYVDILLDGSDVPEPQQDQEKIWMYLNSSSSSESPVSYLPWEVYASSLNYRRISHRLNTSATGSEPFNFAFVPGSLLHSGSSIRVPMIIRAAINFVTYAFTSPNATHAAQRVKKSERQEALLYIFSVSRGMSAELRFDTDAYNPVITKSGIAKKPATAILVVLIVAVVCVLAASVYVEVTYRRIIHNAKYHPKRPNSAVGIRYGRDGKPKEGQKTAKEGSRAEAGAASSASMASGGHGAATDEATESSVKTKFGIVCGEQKRVSESVDGSSSASSDTGGAGERNDDYTVKNPPIGEEQPRVEDDEVAEI